jgi:hypothetical protein
MSINHHNPQLSLPAVKNDPHTIRSANVKRESQNLTTSKKLVAYRELIEMLCGFGL